MNPLRVEGSRSMEIVRRNRRIDQPCPLFATRMHDNRAISNFNRPIANPGLQRWVQPRVVTQGQRWTR